MSSSAVGRKAMAAAAAAAGGSTRKPRFHSALKKLAQHGVAALQPVRTVRPETDKVVWRGAPISGRIAAVLRKTAVKEGTFGSFDAERLRGWDPAWDVDLAVAKVRGRGRHRLRPPKTTKATRTREERARKIEKNMEGMAKRIEEFHAEKAANKPPRTFENTFKNLTKSRR